MPFHFQQLDIPEVILIEPVIFKDNRGFFMESFKQSLFKAYGIPENFCQDNLSYSNKNVIRGLHYQIPPHAQGKLVMALKGEILDVAVDIRKSSPTYGKYVSRRLSDCNRYMLYIPPGFAHGFCVLSEQATVMYKCTTEYAPGHDRGIVWNDPDIGIDWPTENPVLSVKDAELPSLNNAEIPF